MKEKKFKIPIYYGDLVVIIAKDWETVNKKYNTQIENSFEAVVFKIENKKGYVKYCAAFKKDASAGTIAHEAVHVVNKIFIDRYMKLDEYNDEPQAYLMGWVVNRIDEFINKKP